MLKQGSTTFLKVIIFLIGIAMLALFIFWLPEIATFSELSFKSLKVIKKCTFAVIFFIVLGIVSIKVLSKVTGDDAAGPISLSLMGILVTSTVATFVSVLQKPIKNFLEKNEIKM